MRLELPVIRLQVQLDRIKPGIPPHRRYDPAVLREVAELRVTADGAIGVDADGTEHLDVHHRRHPHTRDAKGRSGLSIMTTGDYAALRARYGEHLIDGIAGESILLEYAPGLARRALPECVSVVPRVPGIGQSLIAVGFGPVPRPTAGQSPIAVAARREIAAPGGVISETATDAPELALIGVHVAKPCVEFTRFCLHWLPEDGNDPIRAGLKDLDDGARGYKMVADGTGRVRVGGVIAIDV